jgi:hypothetical protein
MKSAIALWLLVAGVSYAAPLIDEPVAELRLKSGKVLTNAVAKSYSPTAVFVKHADGGTSVKYEEFPAEYTASITAKRPSPPTAEELAAQEKRRQEALAREAARPKTKPVQRTGPSMPLNKAELGLAVSSIQGHVATVEIHNFGKAEYVLEAYSIIATTSDGRKLPGRGWVGLSADGRITAILRDRQRISVREPLHISVQFEPITSGSIVSLDWTHPKN